MAYQSVITFLDGSKEILSPVFRYKTEASSYAQREADRTMNAVDGETIISPAVATHYIDFWYGDLKLIPAQNMEVA